MNVILCGYNWVGCKALKILIEKGHNVFVYTHDSPYYIPSLVDLCKKYDIEYTTDNINNHLNVNPDVICSIYYRNIISKSVIDSCKGKIFNLHPSLLPKYRGCSSISWAMVNGEKETGFTYHYIDEGCDTGDIIYQDKICIEDWDTQETLYMRTMFESIKKFDYVFKFVLDGKTGLKQNCGSSYYKRGCPNNGNISPEWSINKKERFIRAMIYPPLPVAKYEDKDVYNIDEILLSK